jgi:hypothetical protein
MWLFLLGCLGMLIGLAVFHWHLEAMILRIWRRIREGNKTNGRYL